MRQDGYVLLLTLFAIVGVSSAWLSNAQPNIKNYSADQTIELESARQALISYAVNYSDHYGVQGAGIGHLPCPDTDAPDAVAIEPWVRDGPNPPCSRQQIESGWLPRHVNTLKGRYHFHTRSRQRLWYSVSGRFINNPSNRIVNSSMLGDIAIGNHDDVVAVITAPPIDADHTKVQQWWKNNDANVGNYAHAVIRTMDIRQAAMRRVADWLLTRLNTALLARCSVMPDSSQCLNSQHYKNSCAHDAETILLLWLSAVMQSDESALDCSDEAKRLFKEFEVYEGAPYKRHWFFRNGWFNDIEWNIDPACTQSYKIHCQFDLQPPSHKDTKIKLVLKESVKEKSI